MQAYKTVNPIFTIRECVSDLLDKDVLPNTFGVMTRLQSALVQVAGRASYLTKEEKAELKCLERLSSESIRCALHKHELRITNDVIKHKNTILKAMGITPDEFHQEINPANYPGSW
jgi:hypothetical protein